MDEQSLRVYSAKVAKRGHRCHSVKDQKTLERKVVVIVPCVNSDVKLNKPSILETNYIQQDDRTEKGRGPSNLP